VFLEQEAHTLQVFAKVLIAEQGLCFPHPHQFIFSCPQKFLKLSSLLKAKTLAELGGRETGKFSS